MNYDVSKDVAKLKRNLRSLLSRELEDFRTATGLTPSALSGIFAETTTAGDPHQKFMLTDIRVDFRF
jgi:hypothetical protein